jgi:hypothetical protein
MRKKVNQLTFFQLTFPMQAGRRSRANRINPVRLGYVAPTALGHFSCGFYRDGVPTALGVIFRAVFYKDVAPMALSPDQAVPFMILPPMILPSPAFSLSLHICNAGEILVSCCRAMLR